MSTPKPFSLSFTLSGQRVCFTGEPIDEQNGEILYALAPVDDGDFNGSECDVCRKDVETYCLIKSELHPRCKEHGQEGVLINFEPLRLPKPPTLGELLRSTTGEVDERKKVHDMMVALKGEGLSYAEISKQLKALGYEAVQPRTVQKHCLGGCSCYPPQPSS